MKPVTFSCESCGKRFPPARSDAQFCSVACRMRAHRLKQSAAKRSPSKRASNISAIDQLPALADWFKTLRGTITQKRKDHDERMKRRWNPVAIDLRKQGDLLDWIEAELDKVPSLLEKHP
jgi:hypothetical protein